MADSEKEHYVVKSKLMGAMNNTAINSEKEHYVVKSKHEVKKWSQGFLF